MMTTGVAWSRRSCSIHPCRIGIFAQRGRHRPNRLGLTIVRILRGDGRSLFVEGLDAENGTPVLDIKPVMEEFLPHGPFRQPDWSHEVKKAYWNLHKENPDGNR